MPTELESFESLDPWIRDWLGCEQTVNDRISHPRLQHRFSLDARRLAEPYWPESRGIFKLQYLLLEHAAARQYGPVPALFLQHFGLTVPRGKRLLFLHPGNARITRQVQQQHLPIYTSDILATPTSSFRSLLCWHPSRPARPLVLKLALPVRISGVTRCLSEMEVLGSVHASLLLSRISDQNRTRFEVDFFADVAGCYCQKLNLGQIVRLLPPAVAPGARLVPAFSFGSHTHGELFLQQITQTSEAAVRLMESLVASYVRATSFLMLHEGIAHEFHPQNVLFEVQGERVLRTILRDFYRATVSPDLRRHHRRPLPEWTAGRQSQRPPSEYLCFRMARSAPTAYLRVFGVRGVIWEWARALRLLTGQSCYHDMLRLYLRYWQEACAVWLGVWPKRIPQGPSLALNDAITLHLMNAHRT